MAIESLDLAALSDSILAFVFFSFAQVGQSRCDNTGRSHARLYTKGKFTVRIVFG
jgi:hypothetical protein